MTHTQFVHYIPKKWMKGDISHSPFSAEMNALTLALADSTFEPKKFKDLYIAIHKELEENTGVVFVNNSALKNFNAKEKKKIFFQLCQFIGKPVSINKTGELIREVKDSGLKDSIDKPVRGHLTDQSLAFHSDRADITAMLCDTISESGGAFKICSSSNLFDALKAYPQALEILMQDIPHDLRDEGAGGAQICYHPIISNQKSFVVRYIRKFVDSIVRHGMVVDHKITDALNTVDFILNSDGFFEEIYFKPNDMIFFNNHITLHARNAFVDSNKNKRCLFRIWLSSEFSRELPNSFHSLFYSTKAGTHR